MTLFNREECPLCHGRNIFLFRRESFQSGQLAPQDFRITDSRYGRSWRLFACRDCSFVFANPALSDDDLLKFYSGLSDEAYGQESENRGKNFLSILRRLKRLSPQGRGLLDVGAASGIFLDLARGQGYEVAGIEPSVSLVSEAKHKYNLDLYNGSIDSYSSQGRFDVVMLLDILEHVADADRLMARVSAFTREGGLVVVVTPDISSLAARLFGKRWWHLRIAHVQFFNRKSLAYLLKRHGFRIVLKKRYAWNFSLHYLLSRLVPMPKRLGPLQKLLKKLNLKLQLFDSMEVYARKEKD